MRISLTLKLVIGVTLILVVSLAILQRKASAILLTDKVQTLREQSSQVSYSLAVSTSEKVKRLDRHLRLILTHAAYNTPAELRPQGEDMILAGTLLRGIGKPWEANWAIKAGADDKFLENFQDAFAESIQKNAPLEKVRSDEHFFTRLVGLDGQPLFAMLIRMSKAGDAVEKIGVGVLSASAFFDLVAPFKGSLTSAFLIDGAGIAYAHPNLGLTGSLLRGNPIVDRVLQKFSASLVDEYKNGDETNIASFDSVPRTNLVAITSISLNKASASLKDLKWNFWVLGVGLSLLAAILAFYISYQLKSPLSKLRRAIDDLAMGRRSHVATGDDEAEITGIAESLNELDKQLRLKEVEVEAETHDKIYKEKMSAFHRLSTGLVNELRNPLIGVLGHTQLAREKIRDPESIRRHLDLIEKDVRKTKELVEDISQFAGAEKHELSSVNIFEALTASIEQAGRKLHAENINILKNLESVSSVVANPVLLRKALLNVLASCASLVTSEDQKEIIVRLENGGKNADQYARINIIFESLAISADDLGKIFDPFTVTEGGVDLGLDLALARGILLAHSAEIRAEQTGEKHFQFEILLPKVHELPATESPFINNPGLEMKGLSFALGDVAIRETPGDLPATAPEANVPVDRPLVSRQILTRQILTKVPLENMKIRIRKPTLRT